MIERVKPKTRNPVPTKTIQCAFCTKPYLKPCGTNKEAELCQNYQYRKMRMKQRTKSELEEAPTKAKPKAKLKAKKRR